MLQHTSFWRGSVRGPHPEWERAGALTWLNGAAWAAGQQPGLRQVNEHRGVEEVKKKKRGKNSYCEIKLLV